MVARDRRHRSRSRERSRRQDRHYRGRSREPSRRRSSPRRRYRSSRERSRRTHYPVNSRRRSPREERRRQRRGQSVGNPFLRIERHRSRSGGRAAPREPVSEQPRRSNDARETDSRRQQDAVDSKTQETMEFPTNPRGKFAQAMSAIACNPSSGAKGRVENSFSNTFREQVSQALAIKLNLKTNQQANERALSQLLNSKARSGELKQVLQARAAVYEDLLDPS